MVEVLLLGAAQDGGFPQAGCYCVNCMAARQGELPAQAVVSLALIDRVNQRSWLIDATPDLPAQLHRLHEFAPTCPLAGIFLTHAHIGHYTGLIHLGREVMNTQQLPLYATRSLCTYLEQNGPWSQLVRIGNIALHPLALDQSLPINPTCALQPIPVPHRNEYSDTVAFLIHGAHKRLFYCPDIDRWEAWGHDLRPFLKDVDLALLDGTFFSAQELPGRDLRQIPHPLVGDTVERVAGSPCKVYFIHLNHSNPLLRPGPERQWLETQGCAVGLTGFHWKI